MLLCEIEKMAYEASDFTTWLAREDNIEKLSLAPGLQVENIEVSVGPFTSLAHLLTADFLKECLWVLKKDISFLCPIQTKVEDVLLKSRMRENFMSGSVRGLIVTSEPILQQKVDMSPTRRKTIDLFKSLIYT